MERNHSITFNRRNLKCLKENLFEAVYLYLLFNPNELEKEWIKKLRNSRSEEENSRPSVYDVCRIFVYEGLMFPSNMEDIVEMLAT